jgi:hypothetical protein
MDREQALMQSEQLAKEWQVGPSVYRSVAIFEKMPNVQTYIELEGGGIEVYNELLKSDYFFPYFWKVRHFKPGEKNEVSFFYSPTGHNSGFEEIISENVILPELDQEEALVIAESAFEKFGFDVTNFTLVEKSKSTALSGRIDHFFTFEHNTAKFNEATIRQHVTIRGNKLTCFAKGMDIPEGFFTRYSEMRSLNNLIAQFAQVGLIILYGLGGILFGIFVLMKQNYILWKRGVIAAFIVALMGFLAGFNYMPISWMYYRTEISESTFVMQMVMSNLVQFILQFLYLSLSFIAAESLTRKAFPEHVRFWEIWSKKAGTTKHVLGNTLAGYMTSALSLVYILAFYFITTRYFGWWNPASISTDPNTISTLFPWFQAISMALHAGFWEECLFRAVPIASAILIGRKFGKEKLWFGIGLLVQALIFAAGHANYPAQPAYARLIELIIPSMYFAYLYIRHGLLTGIIMHFVFDAVLMSLPIWITSGSKVVTWRIMFVLAVLTPIWILIIRRLNSGKWTEITDKEKNVSWTPKIESKVEEIETASAEDYNILTTKIVSVLGVIAFVVLFLTLPYETNSTALTMKRTDAILRAKDVLKSHGIVLNEEWQTQVRIDNFNQDQDRFIFHEYGKPNFMNLKSRFLSCSNWEVTFVKFSENAEERTERYNLIIGENGIVKKFVYRLPEKIEVKDLGENLSRQIAANAVTDFFHIERNNFVEKTYSPNKLPNRLEHTFVFKDTSNYSLDKGELNYIIKVVGDKPFVIKKEVFVPNNWIRDFDAKTAQTRLFSSIMKMSGILIWVIGIILAIIAFSKNTINKKIVFTSFVTLLLVNIVVQILSIPEIFARFNTSVPFTRQIISSIAGIFMRTIIGSGFSALLFGWIFSGKFQSRKNADILTDTAIGLMMTSVLYIGTKFVPQMEPNLSNMHYYSHYLPLLSDLFNSFLEYIYYLIPFATSIKIIETISSNWTKRIPLTIVLIFISCLFWCGSLMLHAPGAVNIFKWLAISATLTLLAVFTYKNYIRFFKTSVLIIAAIPVIISILLRGYYNLYPGALLSSLISLFIIAGVITMISLTVERDEELE